MQNWAFTLLDSQDRPEGRLDGVEGGSLEIVALSQLGGSGKLQITDTGQGIDWMTQRVQAVFQSTQQVRNGGRWESVTTLIPWGVWRFSSPVERHTEFGLTYEVGVLPKTSYLSGDRLTSRFTLAEGSPIIPAVVSLIESTGETRIAVTDSDATVRGDFTRPAGASKLEVINDLLEAAGYWSLKTDLTGQYRVEPYLNPADRPVAYSFEHGAASIHYPDWSREQNLTDVPNVIVLETSGDSPLVGVARNEDPDSPFSFQARGFWTGPEPETVEAASQQVIDQLAQRRLRDAMNPVARIAAMHDPIPLEANDLISSLFEDGITRRATVQRMGIPITEFPDVSAEWREA